MCGACRICGTEVTFSWDIKPDNFLIGLGRRANQVYAIDFRLAKKYRDSSTHQHIPYRENKNLIGTTRYANMNPSLMKHKRSNIVGLPVSILLLKEDVTVTVVHPRTEDLESMIHEADIFIAAIGQPMMGSWIKVGLWLLMWGRMWSMMLPENQDIGLWLEDGDIICFQKPLKGGTIKNRYQDVPFFLEYVHNHQVVHFRSPEKPEEDQFSLEL
ncbi:unnamed protein product [Lactuca saligna]|uniref:Protein kinase domain-containing protein n=1 Tax=Lactuca saligna TaxID=75948 RepID=A0AA35ZRG0_LACSI|nr:unnamed protein product [Lactuca saligna]